MRTVSFVVLVLLGISVAAAAQTTGQVQLELPVRWTGTAGEPADPQPDVGATLGVEHLLDNGRVRVFYDLDVDTFGTGDSLRTWLHNAGATVTRASARRAFDLGGALFWRANEGTWSDAGFKGVNLLASARLRPRASVTLASAYALYWRTFADRPALDQLEHYGSARLLVNAPTRTTLAGALSVGRKRYDGRAIATEYEEVPFTSGGRGSGGWRQGAFVPSPVQIAGEPGTRHEWSWATRVAQSLDDRTGLWIEREQRRTSGDLPPAIVWPPLCSTRTACTTTRMSSTRTRGEPA